MPQWALGGPKVQPKKPRRALAPQVLEGYRLGDMFWWLDLFSCWIQAWKVFYHETIWVCLNMFVKPKMAVWIGNMMISQHIVGVLHFWANSYIVIYSSNGPRLFGMATSGSWLKSP